MRAFRMNCTWMWGRRSVEVGGARKSRRVTRVGGLILVAAALAVSAIGCDRYETTTERAPLVRQRLDAFEEAVSVGIEGVSPLSIVANGFERLSFTDTESLRFALEVFWKHSRHEWEQLDLTSFDGEAAGALLALADEQAEALAAGGFVPLQATWFNPTDPYGYTETAGVAGARITSNTTVGAITHENTQGFPVRLGIDIVHERVYYAPATGAFVFARNEWREGSREVIAELGLFDGSAVGHAYPVAERSFAESLVTD